MTQNHLDTTIFGEPAPDEPRRRRHQRRKRSRGRRTIALIVAVVLVGVASVTAFTLLKPLVSSIVGGGSSEAEDFPGPGTGDVDVSIKAGDSGETIASTLKAAGVVKTRTAYLDASAADPEQSAKIQAGTYTLKKGMKAIDAFTLLTNPAGRKGGGVTIREGLWATEVYALLSKATGVPVAEYTQAAKNPEAIGLPASAKGNVEGYLFPSTYEFGKSTPAVDQLKAMVALTIKTLDAAGVVDADREKVLTLASLVEAEAKLDEDRPKIARVFLNRIETEGLPSYGLLQSDAAVSYGAKRRSLFPSQAELKDASNPYNTRIHPGLPPGPISNPGRASIDAAAKPADGPWFFFVAVNPITGETKYGTTLAEHNANVRELNAYCKANPKDCGQ
ncbi:hypothetical protein JNB_04185 [Janibacter sp. HTCC2649]|uniref:endolytic transglycosylase MltG n=1 Tax=Janibacter sp. HTCC2649 TaxID=313589 RepID=UPI000066ED73|nr:endolytic transglycosylase MltG [Janibacter sp. HTCC2649]EAP99339.1 hypothetical protein JNB_04185 [Janibacter sp. HTCC2649]